MSVWAAVIVALGMFFITWLSRQRYHRLATLPDHPPGRAANVTAIIPARNEAKNIARCIESLAPQVGSITVVDDGSTDGTADLALAAGAGRVIPAPPLIPGHRGKPNACHAGAQGATTKWLLFADADTWYTPGFALSIASHAESNKLDLVMAYPSLRFRSIAEHVLAPYAFGMYFTGVDAEKSFGWKTRELLATTHCVLFRTDAYEFTDGHRVFVKSIADDLELARLGKRHRLRFTAVRAENFVRVRAYESLAAIRTGFRRHAGQYLNWIVGLCSFWMTLYLPALGWLMYDGKPIATCAFASAPMLATLVWYRNPLAAILAPVAIYLFPVMAIHARMARFFGFSTTWKGRRIR